ncbi:hypothetical protein ACFYYB_25990 [Streptomyces sp. NPDC002886]|uniref:hypothetical protein n=1 Tax=Streptomyces sp. NPDC002886 TaxID=3364667 RepID=UPI0036B1E39D
MPTSDSMPFALIVQTAGQFVLTDWTPTTEPHELLRSEGIHATGYMRPRQVHHALTVWADDDALWRDVPVNHTAERVLAIPHTLCGPVVLTGAIPDSAAINADGLTHGQALHLIERLLIGKRVLTNSLHIPEQRTR